MNNEAPIGGGETIRHIARLAKLALSDQEISDFEKQLNQIVSHFDSVQASIDSLGKDWRPDVIGSPVNERADISCNFSNLTDALAQAPELAGTSFQVPSIIE